MSYSVHLTPAFKRNVKRLKRRFRHVEDDLKVATRLLVWTRNSIKCPRKSDLKQKKRRLESKKKRKRMKGKKRVLLVCLKLSEFVAFYRTLWYDVLMRLRAYADRLGITYKAAWNHFKKGLIPGAYQIATGTIIVPDDFFDDPEQQESGVAIYARVSSSENKKNLDTQAERLSAYCAARGYKIVCVVKEVGSGANDKRKKFLALLASDGIDVIVVEHRDRATRFGLAYIQTLLARDGRKIEVINKVENDKDELMQDLISVITSFVARYYGQRRGKRKTERIIGELQDD